MLNVPTTHEQARNVPKSTFIQSLHFRESNTNIIKLITIGKCK